MDEAVCFWCRQVESNHPRRECPFFYPLPEPQKIPMESDDTNN